MASGAGGPDLVNPRAIPATAAGRALAAEGCFEGGPQANAGTELVCHETGTGRIPITKSPGTEPAHSI